MHLLHMICGHIEHCLAAASMPNDKCFLAFHDGAAPLSCNSASLFPAHIHLAYEPSSSKCPGEATHDRTTGSGLPQLHFSMMNDFSSSDLHTIKPSCDELT